MKKLLFLIQNHWIGFVLAILTFLVLSSADSEDYPLWIDVFEGILVMMMVCITFGQYIDWKDVHRKTYRTM